MKYFLKQAEYYEFVQWIATPEPFRDPKTQMAFQEQYHISHDTLARWKHDPNFWDDVRRVWEGRARERSGTVIEALYMKIRNKPDPISIKLWMQLFEGFTEKSEQTQTHELGTSFFEAMKQRHDKRLSHQQQPIIDGTITPREGTEANT